MTPESRVPVSVVIPAHNRARTLPACLESVLGQTCSPSEVLVVDDGSTDDTAAVLARFSHRGVQHLRLDRPSGAQAARNFGWQRARCAWIAFQDSDDLWLPDRLERQFRTLSVLGDQAAVVIHGEGWRQDGTAGPRTPMRLPRIEGESRARLLLGPGPMFQAMLVPRSVLERAGGLDEGCPAYQEWDTALRLSLYAPFVFLPEPLFVWIRHDGETISRDARRAVRGYRHVTEQHRDEILSVHGLSAWRRLRLDAVALALRAGLWAEALAIIDNEAPHPSLALARALARAKLAPRGTGRLLRLLA